MSNEFIETSFEYSKTQTRWLMGSASGLQASSNPGLGELIRPIIKLVPFCGEIDSGRPMNGLGPCHGNAEFPLLAQSSKTGHENSLNKE